ncbi:MAG: type I phosphomannose isomerase catalytic subunit [Gemmataceae bacterium]
MKLYPLRFSPIFKTMLWGGTRLRPFFGHPTSTEPTGEAWVLSDVDGSPSVVQNGPLAGQTLRQLLQDQSVEILGEAPLANGRFPLLLKFIDAKQELSVQVHPTDEQARQKHPTAAGKTEAWLVLQANPTTSKLYAGFRAGVTAADFQQAMASKTTPATLHQFTPQSGDCLFLRAGTVHAIGTDLMLFEVQQTSDITYRLYDWDRVDAKTGQPRELHIQDGLACSNFAMGPCPPIEPRPIPGGEELVVCEYFQLLRRTIRGEQTLGLPGRCTAIVVTSGRGTLDSAPFTAGEVVLVPATVGTVSVSAETLEIVECIPCGRSI